MITIAPSRTRRLCVRMTELTLDQGISLCKLPAERQELTTSELLRFVAANAEKPAPHFVTDPLLWTVEERTLLVCRYLSHVMEDGPDFKVGDGSLSNYVEFDRDLTVPEVSLGVVDGQERVMRPLLGVHAQTLETMCKKRGEWVRGAIACQIFRKGEDVISWGDMSDVDMLAWVNERVAAMGSLPESSWEALFAAYWTGAESLAHFFNMDFDDQGLIYQPFEKEGAGAIGPARFLASSCVSETTRTLFG